MTAIDCPQGCGGLTDDPDGGPCTQCWGSIADAALDRYAKGPVAWPDQTHDGQRDRDTENADAAGEVL